MHREMDKAEAIRQKGIRRRKARIAFFTALILKAGILHGRGAPVGNGKGESLWNTVLTGIRTAALRCWGWAVCACLLEPGGTAIDYARAGALVDEAVRGGITYF